MISAVSGYAASGYAIWKTLAISVPTVIDAMRGTLSVARADERLRGWSTGIVQAAKIDLHIDGLDRVPRDRAYIFMSNHQSHLDIPIIFHVWPGTLRMVAKAELFRVPVWGRAMRAAGFVSVDRSGDRAQALQAMREAGEAIGRGVSIWIAPEGTRSRDGRLGKFKKGGFLLAKTTGVPIVPMVIDGSRNVLPKHTTAMQTGVAVRVTFGAPISVAERPVDTLMSEVRDHFAAHLFDQSGV